MNEQPPGGPRAPAKTSRPGAGKPYSGSGRPREGAGKWHRKPKSRSGDDEPQRLKEPSGYAVRALAVRLVSSVIDRRRALDDALASEFKAGPGADLEPRDRGLARLIAATVLRRKGEIDAVITTFLERPLPGDRGLLDTILECAAAQLMILQIAPHAVINIAVEQCRHDRGARRFDRLANAVLRRISERGREILETLPGGTRLDIPDWLWDRWVAAYGEATARQIATASLREAPLDVTPHVEAEALDWTANLGGKLLPTGSIRIMDPEARVDALPGFADGAWWVQDAAAALPARLLGDVSGRRVADLCAAPGGKTVQLAARGAHVTAVDASLERLNRVRENLGRMKLEAEIVKADVTTWQPPALFDAILLDAPCTATGTIRRHPDIPHLKRPTDLAPLVELQARMLDHAATLVAPGGTLVYCTCSLEVEEGENQIARFLSRTPAFERAAIMPGEFGIEAAWITPAGDLRTLPHFSPGGELGVGGMDGFYASRLVHRRA